MEAFTKFRLNNRLSIDRIENMRGYEIDNMALACALCNLIKGAWFSAAQMREIAETYLTPKWTALRDQLAQRQPTTLTPRPRKIITTQQKKFDAMGRFIGWESVERSVRINRHEMSNPLTEQKIK